MKRGFQGALAGTGFVQTGANYRELQNKNSPFRRMVNWIAERVPFFHFAANTEREINAKREGLNATFHKVAVTILQAKRPEGGLGELGTFEIGGKNSH